MVKSATTAARHARAMALLAAAVLISVSGTAANASTVFATFEGRVLGGNGSLYLPPELIGLVAAGSPVQGSFRYETEAVDSDGTTTRGDYAQPPGFGIDLTLGGAHIRTDPAGTDFFVQIMDEHPLAGYLTNRLGLISRYSNSALEPSTIAPNQLHIFFESPSLSIESDALHEFTDALLAGEVSGGYGQVATTAEQLPVVFVNFSVDTVRLIQVPEPTSIALLGSGFLWLAMHRFARAQQTP